MKQRISEELAQKEVKELPKQEFRISITLKTECNGHLDEIDAKLWVLEQFRGCDVGKVEVTYVEEHLNRTLDVNQFTDEEIAQAFRNDAWGSSEYFVNQEIERALLDKSGVNIYWNADRKQILAYYR